MGYVPQGREIFARLTVEENILMGMATKSGRAAKTIKGEIFELFPVLRTMLSRRGGDLSGGQQQQLAIARAEITLDSFSLPFGAGQAMPPAPRMGRFRGLYVSFHFCTP